VQDVNELKQRLTDVWDGVKRKVIDNAIDQWHRHLHAYIHATGEHFE